MFPLVAFLLILQVYGASTAGCYNRAQRPPIRTNQSIASKSVVQEHIRAVRAKRAANLSGLWPEQMRPVIPKKKSDEETTTAKLTTTSPPFNEMSCYYELSGCLLGQLFEEPQEIVDCELGTTYCQKIYAHFLTTDGDTKVTMRGCDDFQVGDFYNGISCEDQGEGCTLVEDNFEMYTVCCCKGNICNSGPNQRISISLLVSLLFLVYFAH